jgi:hypothetical protein
MSIVRHLAHAGSGWLGIVLFWMREVAGWVLVLLGLWVFAQCVALFFANPPHLIVGGSLTFMGVIIFRGGIHLLKVATAAQVCLRAQRQLDAPGLASESATRTIPSPFHFGAVRRPSGMK